MMFLDTEEVIKRTSIVLGCAIVIAGFGATYYFGRDLMNKVHEGKSETIALKDEADRLNKETDTIKVNLLSNTKDLKSSIIVASEETKKVDGDVKSQHTTFKQFQQEFDKYKSDARIEFLKLKESNLALTDQIKIKEQYFNEQIRIRDSVIEKNKIDAKAEIAALHDSVKLKDREIADLKSKLDKEIEWRNRSFFTR